MDESSVQVRDESLAEQVRAGRELDFVCTGV